MSLLLGSCLKQRFFPDPFDPQLSRLTDSRYQTGTCYINGDVYINDWPESGFSIGRPGLPYPSLRRTRTQGADSMDLSWKLMLKEKNTIRPGTYYTISLRMPVRPGFTVSDIQTLEGLRFASGQGRIYLDHDRLSGSGGIYFIKVRPDTSGSVPHAFFYMSGIFEGDIGDTIQVKKGRFDFVVDARGF